MTIRSKLIALFVMLSVVLGLVGFGLSKLLTTRVNAFVINLAEKMTQEIGHPVIIDKVVTKWDWLMLKVNIKNLKILDKDDGVALFMASEIVSTVDTLDSIRSLSLKFKHLLLRSPRLVMQWNGIAIPSVLGLGHEDVSGQMNPAGILKILAMQRRIVVENGDLHLQGKDGADLPFMDIKIDFRKTAEHEYNIIARGNIAAAVQPEFVFAAKYHGDLADYKKALMEFEIKTSNVQLADLLNFVPQYKQNIIHGNFSDFDLKGVVQNGTVRSITSDFNINNIVIAQDTIIKGGMGHLEYKPGNNRSSIQFAHLTIANDKLYAQPISIDAISSDVLYSENATGLQFMTQNARIKLMELEIYPDFNVQFNGNKIDALDFISAMDEASVRRLLVLLPDRKFPVALNEWLKRSLTNGIIESIKVNYAKEKLSWALGFKHTELKFSPDWPSVYDIDAILSMNDGKLSIVANRALILGNEIRTLAVSFSEHVNNPYAVITIDGSTDTTLESGLAYIQQTPLRENIGSRIEALNPNGAIGLDLQLKINTLQPTLGVAVNGAIKLNHATAKTADINLTLNDLTGLLRFTNTTFSSENLQFTLFDQPAKATIAMHRYKPNTLNVAVAVPFHISSLKQLIPDLNLQYIEGNTNIIANIELPWGGDKNYKTLNISSDMLGVNVNYPPPFNKTHNTKMPLTLQYNMTAKHEDMIKFKYNDMEGLLFLKDNKLHGGHVAIGKKLDAFNETENLQISGNIKKLDWAVWSPLLSTQKQNEWLPLELDLLINSFTLYGEEYKPMLIKYATAKNELFLDCKLLTGTIVMNRDDEKIDVKLKKFNMPEKRMKNNALLDYVRDKKATNQLPVVQFYCDTLQFNKRTFKKISLELLPRPYGYEIMNLTLNNDNLLLQAQGSWQMDNKPYTMLSGNAYTQNVGNLLLELGLQNSITRGKGEVNFSVQWEGGPIDFDVLKLDGASHLDLRFGSLTNVNPGLGRIIGLLSLESIQRRLQLDFSDLLSRGFAFDKFVADLKIQPGSVMSDNILINSPSAKIELYGKTGIKSQDLDFTMYVTPKVGASLPIAAAIAAGPAVGAAIWLFDKASGSKISEITKYKYKVSGTWDAPQIDEISNLTDKILG